MIEKVVELIGRLESMSPRSWELGFLMAGSSRPRHWHEIEEENRFLIVADPGEARL